MIHSKGKLSLRLAALVALLTGMALGLSLPLVAQAATLTVNSTDDAGDTIEFNLTYPATIILGGAALQIDKNLTITGPGADQLTISGDNASHVFNITGGTIIISDLTIANGNKMGNGGGIYNDGDLTLTNCTISGNEAAGTYSDGDGIGDVCDSTLYQSTPTPYPPTPTPTLTPYTPMPTPSPIPVGGVIVPVSKVELLAPWVGLAALMAAMIAAVVVRRRA